MKVKQPGSGNERGPLPLASAEYRGRNGGDKDTI